MPSEGIFHPFQQVPNSLMCHFITGVILADINAMRASRRFFPVLFGGKREQIGFNKINGNFHSQITVLVMSNWLKTS